MRRRIPPLIAVRAFEAAARHGSFTDAADELAVTPTAISHQIRHLEKLLNLQLFDRNGRNLSLTEQGKRILPEVTRGFDCLAAAFFETYGEKDNKSVNVSVTREFARYWLFPRLNNFYERFPDYAVNVIASEKCTPLDSSEADLVIRYGPKAPPDSVEINLYREEYLAVCSPSMLSEGNQIENLTSKRLLDVRWELSSLNSPTWKRWFSENNNEGYEDYIISNVDAYNLALDAVIRGNAAALISNTIFEAQELNDKIVVLNGARLPGYFYRAVLTIGGTRKKAAQNFLRWLQDEVGATI
ncbi:Glycine cleavage system transcriptional activator [Pseudovibrio sp. Ad13]|uniref:LysR family transcriptional regulator n=1 Tax=Pseudovibrio sp. Ad13 TaxID=989396 RepID=UPI0007AE7F8A|nr:LysR family transcriptional regulator [Pseudovibrio sp. Ad13]KZK79045.1 Glycine cleavage system transcriptional activator [Pseudovibrio sp. Ad13]